MAQFPRGLRSACWRRQTAVFCFAPDPKAQLEQVLPRVRQRLFTERAVLQAIPKLIQRFNASRQQPVS